MTEDNANEFRWSDDGENGDATDEHRFTDCRAIRVNPKTCVIHFEPGHVYTRGIQFSNITGRPQIIRITRPPDGNIFKFADSTDVFTLPGYGSRELPFTFASRSDREWKSYLRVKNATGQGNSDVELRAIPKRHSSSPRAINFGNVDIGMSVSRKFTPAPAESNPYQFRIFIPHGLQGLRVNPTRGEVFSHSPAAAAADVTVVYTAQSYVTLRVDLVLYLCRDGVNQKPQIITVTAVTKPKTNRIKTTKTVERTKTKVIQILPSAKLPNRDIPPTIRPPVPIRDNAKSDIVAFNRLTMNKMLARKQKPDINPYEWLSPLGESNKACRDLYAQNSEDFVAETRRFGDEHKRAGFKASRCELVTTDEQLTLVTERREAEWNAYEEKLYRNVSTGDEPSSGYRERSIRTNYIKDSRYDFDPEPDDNWCTRFETYNKFVTAVNTVIIKNRLAKRLKGFRALMENNLI